MDPKAVRAWLSLGFVPGDATILDGVRCLPGGVVGHVEAGAWKTTRPFRLERRELCRDESSLREEATRCMSEAISAELEKPGPHIVPLSGGLDSRILLGSLLERVPAKSLITYTYGVPGTDDFEIGNRVAALAGTTHHAIDLEGSRGWIRNELEEIADLTDANNSLFHPLVWLRVFERVGREGTWWSGFTGDGVAGSFAGRLDHAAAPNPVDAFLTHELSTQASWRGCASSGELAPLCAVTSPLDDLIAPVESIWFANHVERYTTHHIFLRGIRYACPYMHPAVVEFFCSLPFELRREKRFFNEWSSRRWPNLFALPTKDYGWKLAGSRRRQLGWRLSHVVRKAAHRAAPRFVAHPHTSYWDFDVELRREPLNGFVFGLLNELHDSGTWDRAEWLALWKRQQRGERWATLLLNGASLAIVQGMLEMRRRP